MILYTKSPEETIKVGKKIASIIKKGDLIGFIGELGSGKTTMIKGIVKHFTGRVAVSPTYIIVNEYLGKTSIFHFDFYRLSCEDELINIGWEDYQDKGIILIEWADRMKDALPAKTIYVKIELANSKDVQRKISISGLKGRKFF